MLHGACYAWECRTVVRRAHWAAWAACFELAIPFFMCLLSGIGPDSASLSCFCVLFGDGSEALVDRFHVYRPDPEDHMTLRMLF